MKDKTAVKNSGKLGDGKSRIQQQIDAGLRCCKCTIFVASNAIDIGVLGVPVFDKNINMMHVVDGEILCTGCANGV